MWAEMDRGAAGANRRIGRRVVIWRGMHSPAVTADAGMLRLPKGGWLRMTGVAVAKQLRALQRALRCALAVRGQPSASCPWAMP